MRIKSFNLTKSVNNRNKKDGNYKPKSGERKDQIGYIYIIQNPYTKLIKVGYTDNINRRMMQYASHAGHYMTLLAVFDGTMAQEAEIIAMMKPYRQLFDWFTLNPIIYKILDFLKDYGDQFIREPLKD